MKIWFGATSAKFMEYKDVYKSIRNYLVKKGNIILDDWLDCVEERLKKNPGGSRNIKKIFKGVLAGIGQADISIIENTVPNFSVAHQIVYSIMKHKPTLVMWQKKDNENYSDSYLEALESKYLTIKQYNMSNYQDILNEFLGFSKIEFGQKRYNIVLENKQRFYLDWAKSFYRKSRSEIIRNALDLQASENQNFKKYI